MTASHALPDPFDDWVDPRTRQCPHALDELLLAAISAILSGADTWVIIALWGRAKLDWPRQFLPFANGIAAHDTFGRVFSLLDANRCEACLVRWRRAVCGAFEGLQVAIDGKTLRRAKTAGESAIHLVSAFAQGLGLTLGPCLTPPDLSGNARVVYGSRVGVAWRRVAPSSFLCAFSATGLPPIAILSASFHRIPAGLFGGQFPEAPDGASLHLAGHALFQKKRLGAARKHLYAKSTSFVITVIGSLPPDDGQSFSMAVLVSFMVVPW